MAGLRRRPLALIRWLLLISAGWLVGCSPQPAPTPAPWQPTLRFSACAGADLPSFTSRCAQAELEPSVSLSVAVIEPTGGSSMTPVVYIAGGPGEGGNTTAKLDEWRFWASDVGLQRPLILWQPRGTLGSAAYFECASFSDWLEHSESGSDESMLIAMESCLVQWQAQWPGERGFEQFASHQSARDLRQILQLLGVDRWHLWASSYGGRTAQWLLHEGGGVASVIFDSAVTGTLQRPSDFARRWASSMEQLLARACEVNGCEFAQLKSDFWRASEHVQARALQQGFTISQEVFAHWVFAHAFDDAQVAKLPAVLQRFNRDTLLTSDLVAIEQFVAHKTAPVNNPWAYYATLCNDLFAQSPSEFAAEVKALGRWQVFWRNHELSALCPLLGVHPEPLAWSENNQQAVPAVFTAGQFDPVIPFGSVERARQQYPQAALLVKPRAVHGLVREQLCGDKWLKAFWLAPEALLTDIARGENVALGDCYAQ